GQALAAGLMTGHALGGIDLRAVDGSCCAGRHHLEVLRRAAVAIPGRIGLMCRPYIAYGPEEQRAHNKYHQPGYGPVALVGFGHLPLLCLNLLASIRHLALLRCLARAVRRWLDRI